MSRRIMKSILFSLTIFVFSCHYASASSYEECLFKGNYLQTLEKDTSLGMRNWRHIFTIKVQKALSIKTMNLGLYYQGCEEWIGKTLQVQLRDTPQANLSFKPEEEVTVYYKFQQGECTNLGDICTHTEYAVLNGAAW